jgi:glutaminyl-tRNA synthetase
LEETIKIDIPFSMKDPKFGTHEVPFTKTVYIDRSDFREEDSKGYFRLAPGKTVGLLQAPHPIKATSFTKDEATGLVTGVTAVFDKEAKAKTYIQWVPEGSIEIEARVQTSLFNSDDPTAVEGGFMNDIRPNSEVIYKKALIEVGFEEVRRRAPWPATAGETSESSGPESVRFQGLRVGYFVSSSCLVGAIVVLLTIRRLLIPTRLLRRLFSTGSCRSRRIRGRSDGGHTLENGEVGMRYE